MIRGAEHATSRAEGAGSAKVTEMLEPLAHMPDTYSIPFLRSYPESMILAPCRSVREPLLILIVLPPSLTVMSLTVLPWISMAMVTGTFHTPASAALPRPTLYVQVDASERPLS
jgi:hypothetical protein